MRLIFVLDCVDADVLADFWSAALGFGRTAFSGQYVRLTDPAGRWPDLLLQQVPEPRLGKNRMHLDIHAIDAAAEVARLTALGASVIDPAHDDEGYLTTILADPQGNEFCVLRPPEGSSDHRKLVASD